MTNLIYIDTEEWLEGRSHGIGGSEAGIILGLNPWKSRLELWNEKVTNTRHLDPDAEIRLKLGNILEPMIAEEYSKITGRELEIRPQKVHPKFPFILGNIDREIVSSNGRGPGILEIKTKGAFTNWEDDIPVYYQAQLQHYIEIYGYKWGSFSILDLGTYNINIVDVERDDELINKLLKEEIEFWRLVENNTPPPVCPTKACEKFLREKYKTSEDITIDLKDNEEATKWSAMLKEAKRNIKTFDIMETEAKNHLMSIMGSAEKAVGNMYSISWKSPKDKEIFELERFKRNYPELAKKYIKSEPQTRRFAVRFIEDKQTKNRKKDTKIESNNSNIEIENSNSKSNSNIEIENSGLNVVKGILEEGL